MKLHLIVSVLLGFAACGGARACETPVSVCARDPGQALALIRAGQPLDVYIDAGADPAVKHAGRNFAADLGRVAGQPAQVLSEIAAAKAQVVIIGVLGQSPLIAGLVAQGKLKTDDLKGQWEAYRQVVVERPFKGVERALVIVGADRRGAVFGSYDLSAKLGVSPWHWWADVPVAQQSTVFITAGQRRDQPQVKYRGIFINDEDPGFSTWARAKFGGINAPMYATVFELMLRLKANYLWPAMWGKAFNADDPQNMLLADEMGVIMGSSHHEPMMRAHDEWQRFKGNDAGKWDYTSNSAQLRDFWRGGIQRMFNQPGGRPLESLVTIGMRGDGDEPMSEGTATRLLEGIVADQRKIIAEVSGQPAERTPQMWALYKEVQDYYDAGMKVPDDVLLLFADDNWGHLRRLPDPGKSRAGGYGVYYHFDYVGGPRNYKWLNTNQIEKVWQQMNLAQERGADALWIVNVGDIKPMEFPTSFFLDMAWNPGAMTLEGLNAYPAAWAAATFGATVAKDIGEIVTRYSQFAARRKPELIDSKSFPLGAIHGDRLDGGEFGRMIAEWTLLERQVRDVRQRLRPEQLDAFFQLVEHPVSALANLYQLYYAVAWNTRLAAAQDPRANVFADLAEAAFKRDQAITDQYHAIAGGKWAGMMLQTHIGYTNWQQPQQNLMPALTRVAVKEGQVVDAAMVMRQLGVAALTTPGVVSIEAPNFSRTVAGKGLRWTVIKNLGRTQGAVTALPQGHASTTLADNVRLEYDIDLAQGGDTRLLLSMVPTLDTSKAGGVRLAVGIDERPPQVLTLDLRPTSGPPTVQQERDWEDAVRDNAFVLSANFKALSAGKHVLKIWRLDDNAVLQKLVWEPAGARTRNLLGELRPAINEQQIDAKLAAYWQSLFEGDAEHRVYYPAAATADGPSAYILDVGNDDVRSEGMSYGMMIALQMNRKAEFDALWNWAATHMRYAQGPRAGYFRWQCRPPGCSRDEVPASDGEAYFATALLMAAQRWGDGQGIYAYSVQAKDLLEMMLHKEAKNGGVVDQARNMFSTTAGQVVFVPVGESADFSDPSYHLPAFYELWAQRARTPQDRQRWAEIAQISRQYFSKAAHPKTGLTPDYAEFDGRPRHLDGHGDFRYDAFRTAMNWAVDQTWWGKNPAAIELSRRLLSFFNNQPQQPYPALYRVDGLVLDAEPSPGLIASNAVAALLVEPPLAARFVNDLWALEPPSGKWRYYNGLLQFMAMLHVSGRFQAH